MRLHFELRGVTALLMHQDDVEASDRLDAWRKDPKNKGVSKAGDDRSPGWTWQTYCYHDGKSLALPAANLMVALRQAGAQMILKKQKTFKEISQSGMFIEQEFVGFQCGAPLRSVPIADIAALAALSFTEQADAVRKHGFRLWLKRAKIGTSKHVRCRPRFDQWAVSGTITTVAQELTEDAVRQLFTLAGRVGLCDWRPGCKTPGPFGMFDATVEKE